MLNKYPLKRLRTRWRVQGREDIMTRMEQWIQLKEKSLCGNTEEWKGFVIRQSIHTRM
jgi:hypothetical protein